MSEQSILEEVLLKKGETIFTQGMLLNVTSNSKIFEFMNRNTSCLVTCLSLQHLQRHDFLNSNTCFCLRLYGIHIFLTKFGNLGNSVQPLLCELLLYQQRPPSLQQPCLQPSQLPLEPLQRLPLCTRVESNCPAVTVKSRSTGRPKNNCRLSSVDERLIDSIVFFDKLLARKISNGSNTYLPLLYP